MNNAPVLHESSDAVANERGNTRRLYGIVEFKEPLLCQTEALGSVFQIRIGRAEGHFELPALPIDSGRPSDPLHEPLLPPVGAKTWKDGNREMSWGRRFFHQYPSGLPEIQRALLQFDVFPDQVAEISNSVYQHFGEWKTRLFDGFDLFSSRWIPTGASLNSSIPDGLDLFLWNECGKPERPYTGGQVSVCTPTISSLLEVALTRPQFRDACKLASSNAALPVPYQFQLAAYRAIRDEDYRKAVIETAVATEITLTQALEERLSKENVPANLQTFKQYKTLGGRVKLAETMRLALPNDIREALVDPRNAVAHLGHHSTKKEALRAVLTSRTILIGHLPPLA